MVHSIPQEYRLPWMGELDPRFRNFLTGSAVLGLLVVAVILSTPRREHAITEVTQVPDRFAKLILQEPKAAPPAAPKTTTRTTPKTQAPEAPPPPTPVPRRREAAPKVAPDAGQAGRAKARQEVAANLQGATEAAKSAISDLSASLGKTAGTTPRPTAGGRRHTVGRGRGTSQVTRVTGSASAGGGASVSGSAVAGSLISVEAVSDVEAGGAPDGAAGGSGASAGVTRGNAARTNSSLLAVVRRYAPGIQFCYDNELKRTPGLRGKIVAALTVTASGTVSDVRIVSDSVGSQRLTSCVLAQIREWRFPAVSGGAVVFKTPFVFTPPQE